MIYLHVVPLVVVTALAEQAMGNDVVDIKLIQYRISVLLKDGQLSISGITSSGRALLKLAVNTTTSYISPIFFKKLSTPGRLMT